MDSTTKQRDYQHQYYQRKKSTMSAEELEAFNKRKADIQRRYAHSQTGQQTLESWRQQEAVKKRHADAERRRRGSDRYREIAAEQKAKRDAERSERLQYRQDWLKSPAGVEYLERQRELARERARARGPRPRRQGDSPQEKMKARGRRLLRLYGITLDDYLGLYESQEGVCALCQDPISVDSRNTHVDHIETVNGPVVRGLLCGGCNKGLGIFRDSPDRLRAATTYLEKWEAIIASSAS